MLPLKKIFPVIIALITLSLLGIIYIQYSWIDSVARIKREEKEQKTAEAVIAVREVMVNRQIQVLNRLKIDAYKQTGPGGSIFLPEVMNPNISVGQRFDQQEVSDLLKNAFKERKLDTVFEFGVLNKGYALFSSAHFTDRLIGAVEDSALYLQYAIPLSENIGTTSPEALVVFVPQSSLTVFKSLGWMIFGGILFTIIIVTAFALTIRTMLGQKKLSEIKSDFINNMTHELKTPLATISLAIDAIGNERVMDNRDKIRYFSGIIKEENRRMNKQVESILQSALMEKEEIALNLQPMDVHHLITNTVENLQLQLEGKNGRVDLQLNAHQPIIKADEVHFSNLIFNLLDNAIKYSKDNLEIRITTGNTRKNLVISIADNGIGMSRDTVSRIFEKFYRAHTGNVHNVKGFGLGLSYVKAIVDAHKGKIRVESILGKGSRFTMEFPQE
ncbi:sensor histidine kinase [Chitinophaga alhagiae]|uniref:histidine kinase n=1 Tax=Chitinophaga alhagiae TaxID=2203219 RepID=A0ABN5LXD8_9BACT|nr:HAMP domain-containing sensor histidine kinase [Chitinophaga alhagiae]AWO00882.1 sensor histidine kinase [Chitinophaga alhagiae]